MSSSCPAESAKDSAREQASQQALAVFSSFVEGKGSGMVLDFCDFSDFSDLQLCTFLALCWLVLLPVLSLQNFLMQVLTFVRFAVMDLRKQMEAQHLTLRSDAACNVVQTLQTILEKLVWHGFPVPPTVKAGQIVTNSSQATSEERLDSFRSFIRIMVNICGKCGCASTVS